MGDKRFTPVSLESLVQPFGVLDREGIVKAIFFLEPDQIL